MKNFCFESELKAALNLAREFERGGFSAQVQAVPGGNSWIVFYWLPVVNEK